MAEQNNNAAQQQQDSGLSMQDLFYLCLDKWQWFVASVLVCLSLAMLYLLRTPSVYTRTASILVKDDNNGNSMSSDIESFANFGIFSSTTNVNNEMAAITSPDLMREVVKRLDLSTNYLVDGRFHDYTLYGDSLPVKVTFENVRNNETAQVRLELTGGGNLQLSDFAKDGDSAGDGPVSGKIGTSIPTPIGNIRVDKGLGYSDGKKLEINVSRSTLHGALAAYSSGLSVALDDKKSDIITMSFSDVSIQRAEDVLNTLITVYNESWVKNKNEITVATSIFINERLGVIEGELGHVDSDISSYKSANLVPDLKAAANMYMAQASEAQKSVADLNNQAYMARYIRKYLTNTENKNQLLPVNSGLDNTPLATQISEYNKKLLDRNSLASQSSTNNPLVAEMDASLSGMRRSLLHSVDNQIVALNEQIRSAQSYEGDATTKIASNPKQSKYLLSVERQQKVKETLYLYLLQKREENELSQAFTAYNTRVISKPNGSNRPTSPSSRKVMLVAFVLGLCIPVGFIYARESMNTVVRGRKDLEGMTVPFLGEIPYAFGKKKKALGKPVDDKCAIVVKEKSRNVINEAFRVVRTNLEFVQGKDRKANVIMLTSANSGSGKTFITYNLAKTLAIKGKRVVALDLDMRKGSLSNYIGRPKVGISNYLAGQVADASAIVNKTEGDMPFHIIPVGTIPPNPTELLFADELTTLLDQLRSDYDYVFIDCPPAEIVADADIINKHADMTLFVIRSGLFERNMLPVVDKYYTDQKYKNMSILLNGTDGTSGRYGYKYGYKYGYHYGYNGYTTD